MKTIKHILAFVCCFAALASCDKNDQAKNEMTADVTVIDNVAAHNPAEIPVTLTSNTNWIVQTPDWLTPSVTYGSGNAIVTFKVEENYVDELTTVKPRSGEIKFSGGGAINGDGVTVIVSVTQLGYTYVDLNPPLGGIPDADAMVDFLRAAASGSPVDRWTDESGEVVLLADIDLASVTDWSFLVSKDVNNGNNDCVIGESTGAFSGIFNGNGFKITNFNATAVLTANETFGLFPVLDEAEIKNVDLSGTMTVSTTGKGAFAGLLAGTALNSVIKDVTVSGKVISTGAPVLEQRFGLGGICGFACATGTSDALFENCVSKVEADAVCGENTKNNGDAVMYGGIVGFSTYNRGTGRVKITNCTNDGDMTVKLGRCSGIVATPNGGTVIDGCTNNGDQINTIEDGRLGNICCVIGSDSKLIDCTNNGNIEAMKYGTNTGTCAGLVGLLNHATVTVEGGANYGTMKSSRTDGKYIGLLVANFSKFASVKNVIVSGGIEINGTAAEITESNFMSYIGTCPSANESKVTGLSWVAPKQ